MRAGTRVTAEDGAVGEGYLKQFRNSENLIPTVLTTSRKLSTGVDACNVRSIVLFKQVKSMVEFMQMAVVGFDPDRLREIQRNTGRQACDILDVMFDIAYDVEPVTREFRARKAERDAKPMSAERKALFDVIVGNYVRDGVWTSELPRLRTGTLLLPA